MIISWEEAVVEAACDLDQALDPKDSHNVLASGKSALVLLRNLPTPPRSVRTCYLFDPTISNSADMK